MNQNAVAQESSSDEMVELCLEGTVIDAVTKQPIPDAEILRTGTYNLLSPSSRNPESVKTNQKGYFKDTWNKPVRDDGRKWMEHIVVYVDGYVNKSIYIQNVESTPDCKSIEIELEKGASLEGIVLDEEGQPIEGVVVFNPYSSQFSELDRVFPKPVYTDINGKFVMPGLYPDLFYTFSLEKSGFVSQRSEEKKQGEIAEIIMEKAAAPLTVIASGPDSEPLSQMTITACRIITNQGKRSIDYFSSSETDDSGLAIFDNLKPGDYYVSIFPQFASRESDPSVSVMVHDSEQSTFEYQLPEPMRVSGKVLDVDTQEPIAGVEFKGGLFRTFQDVLFINTSVSDEKGDFEVLVYGEKGARATALFTLPEGYIRTGFFQYPSINIPEFVSGGEENIDIELQKGVPIQLKIVGDVQSESARTRMMIIGTSGLRYHNSVQVNIEDPEEFLLPANQQVNLTLFADNVHAETKIQTGDIGTKIFREMEVKPYGSIRGRVTVDEVPVAGLSFTANRKIASNHYSMATSGNNSSSPKVTDENGEFQFDKVLYGTLVLKFYKYEGSLPVSLPFERTIEVDSSEEVVLNIELEPAKTVVGRVTDRDGLPIEGASVGGHHVHENGGGMSIGNPVQTNMDGQFTLIKRANSEDINQVQVNHPNYFHEVAYVVEGEPLTVTLQSRPQVDVRVIGLVDQGSILMSVSYPRRDGSNSSGQHSWMINQDDQPPYRVGIPQMGELRAEAVELDQSGNRTGRIAVTDFGQEKGSPIHQLILDFSQQTTFSGTVTDQNGNPFEGAELYLLAPGNRISDSNIPEGKYLHRTVSDSEGKFIFEQVQPADYELSVMTPRKKHYETVDIPQSGLNGHAITIEVFDSVFLTGVVSGLDGHYLGADSEPIQYELKSVDGKNEDKEGILKFPSRSRFKISDIPLGEWEMTITYSDEKFQDTKTFRANGTREEVSTNFSIVQTIEITGTISNNGKLWNGEPELTITTRGYRQPIISLGDGKYKTQGTKGTASLIRSPYSYLSLYDFEIPEYATSWEQNFELELGNIQVQLNAEETSDRLGIVSIMKMDVPPYQHAASESARGERLYSFDYIRPGNYVVHFTFQSTGKRIESEKFYLDAGAEKNIELTIDPE